MGYQGKRNQEASKIPRSKVENYIRKADCILIGPGLMRTEKVSSIEYTVSSIEEIEKIEDEGELPN